MNFQKPDQHFNTISHNFGSVFGANTSRSLSEDTLNCFLHIHLRRQQSAQLLLALQHFRHLHRSLLEGVLRLLIAELASICEDEGLDLLHNAALQFYELPLHILGHLASRLVVLNPDALHAQGLDRLGFGGDRIGTLLELVQSLLCSGLLLHLRQVTLQFIFA